MYHLLFILITLFSFYGSFHLSYLSRNQLLLKTKSKMIMKKSTVQDSALTFRDENAIIFGGVKFLEPIASSLISMGILVPSPIQSSSMLPLNAGMSAILHAETGSGKTLSYLLPMLKRIQLSPSGYRETTPAIQAFIIVPTKELVLQVASDLLSLVASSSTSLVTNDNMSNLLHLCISTNRKGFDNVTSPIVIGTPVKIVDAMKSSSSSTFKSVHYIVLDEVDRLLSVVGKYATTEEKRKSNENDNLTELILSNILWKVKKTEQDRQNVQIIAVSATVGRPMRRQLSQIISGGTSYDNFPIIRPGETLQINNNPNNIIKKSRNENNNDENNNLINSNRKISIPNKIKHICILIDCETDDISTKIVKVKEKWNLCKMISSNSKRGIIFVPKKSDVKNIVGMLKFWGVKECIDLQTSLGLEISSPVSSTDTVTNRYKKPPKRVPEKTMSTNELINLAQKNRLGAFLSTASNSDNNNATEPRLFVAPVVSARGLHLQDINTVFITYCPSTMDEYLHMAGRTGRMSGGHGVSTGTSDTNLQSVTDSRASDNNDENNDNSLDNTVISFINYEELKRLQSWQVPLGIQLKVLFE